MLKRINLLFLFCGLTIGAYSQVCGAVQSLSLSQQSAIANLTDDLDTALKYEVLGDIDSISNLLKGIYNSEGGIPEVMENGSPLNIDTSWIDLPNTILLSRTLIDANTTLYADLWKMAKGMAPPGYNPHSIFLRTAAEIAAGLFKIADQETDLTRKNLYQSWAIQAMDSLATMQLPNGAFPFPDLRTYGDPVFTTIIQNFMIFCGADSTNVLQNGWIVDDKGTGEFKFDAGVIANSFFVAYQYTGNVQYKNIVLAIGDYLKPLKFNRNYNYNSFVALGLERAWELSFDTSYLYRGAKNMRFAMQPGQLNNGRWMDGHNAKSVYHSIMIQNTTLYENYYTQGEFYFPAIDSMIRNAITNMVNYTFNCGANTGFRWLIRTYDSHIPLSNDGLSDSIHRLVGQHIHQSALDGSFMDVPTMGDYIELLNKIIHLGNETIHSSLKVNIQPNPVTDFVNISFDNNYPEVEISIVGMDGRICMPEQTIYSTNPQIDLSIFPPGIYFLIIRSGPYSTTQKLIKIP